MQRMDVGWRARHGIGRYGQPPSARQAAKAADRAAKLSLCKSDFAPEKLPQYVQDPIARRNGFRRNATGLATIACVCRRSRALHRWGLGLAGRHPDRSAGWHMPLRQPRRG